MTFTICSNANLTESAAKELADGTRRHRLLLAKPVGNLVKGVPEDSLSEAQIAFGQPDPEQVIQLQNLKWIHITSAGYTRYDRPDFRAALSRRGAIFTNSSSVYDEPCAQHTLAFMLAWSRQLPTTMANQFGPRRWESTPIRAQSHLLIGQSALLLGFGAIARRLVQLLSPFQMNLAAVRRKVTGDEPISVQPVQDLDNLLGQFDHVINILPAAEGTDRIMTAARFARMKPGAVYYNIGRGNTTDQDALRKALESGHLGAAYLDVTEPEPLPPDHPFWTTPRCYITPHTGGGHANEFNRLVKHFLGNLHRYENGSPLLDRVM